jgi:hypothetical protein
LGVEKPLPYLCVLSPYKDYNLTKLPWLLTQK